MFMDDIRELLKATNLSGVEISRETGLTQAAISNFKSGKKSLRPESLDKLADVLGRKIVLKNVRRKRTERERAAPAE